MRYAIISDIHANAAALRTALADIADMKVDRIICLGDCVGYGLEPVETLELLYRKAHVVLMGNHDAAVCGKLGTRSFSERAAKAVERHRLQISETGMRWLERLPLMAEGKNFRCTHGDFSRPELFRYVFTPEEALPSWEATTDTVLFVGHTHYPRVHVIGASGVPHAVEFCDFECEEGKRYIINPGSIGAPRTDNARSTYCIYDDKARTVEFRSLPFDFEAYVKALQSANMDIDPAVLKNEAAQAMPEVREGITFSNHSEMEAAQNVVQSTRLPSTKFLQRLATTLVLGLLLILAAAVYTMVQIQKDLEPKTFAGFIPSRELPVLHTPAQQPSDMNLLPAFPKTIGERGLIQGWRYCVEEGPLQHVKVSENAGENALHFSHDQFLRLSLESPTIALNSNPDVKALRIKSRVRRNENFNGTVMANIAMLAKKEDGSFEQLSTVPFEVRNTRGEPQGSMSLNRKIPLAKRTTHVRFSLVTTFKGSLEIEQPVLTGEKDD